MRLKARAILGDLAHGAEAEHLIAAAIGQDRPRPVHEAMQPAQLANPLMTGTQIQMVGIAEQDLTPNSCKSRGNTALTVPCVPTGMKQGVSTTPCGVVRRPRRALVLVSFLMSVKDCPSNSILDFRLGIADRQYRRIA